MPDNINIEDLEFDGRSMSALQEADHYLLVTLKKNEKGSFDSNAFSSDLITMPYCIDEAKAMYEAKRPKGGNYED